MNREKQIEEMAKVIDTCPYIAESIGTDKHEGSTRIAQYFYNAGYRKQSEGEWVQQISKDKNGRCFNYAPSCSVCGYADTEMTNFCPNCGAKMKGGAE